MISRFKKKSITEILVFVSNSEEWNGKNFLRKAKIGICFDWPDVDSQNKVMIFSGPKTFSSNQSIFVHRTNLRLIFKNIDKAQVLYRKVIFWAKYSAEFYWFRRFLNSKEILHLLTFLNYLDFNLFSYYSFQFWKNSIWIH
jgi:hypothetical protein